MDLTCLVGRAPACCHSLSLRTAGSSRSLAEVPTTSAPARHDAHRPPAIPTSPGSLPATSSPPSARCAPMCPAPGPAGAAVQRASWTSEVSCGLRCVRAARCVAASESKKNAAPLHCDGRANLLPLRCMLASASLRLHEIAMREGLPILML